MLSLTSMMAAMLPAHGCSCEPLPELRQLPDGCICTFNRSAWTFRVQDNP